MPVQNNCQNALFQTVRRTVFNSSGTYTKPANLAYAQFIAIGAGSSQQRVSNATTDSITIVSSGSGGQVGYVTLSAAAIPSSLSITIGGFPGATSGSVPAGGATIVSFSTPAQVEGGSGSGGVSTFVNFSGTNPPSTTLSINGAVSADPGWDLVFRGTSGVAPVAFNRWPGLGTNFRLVWSQGNGTSVLGAGFNLEVINSELSTPIRIPLGVVQGRGNSGTPQVAFVGTDGGSSGTGFGSSNQLGRVIITEFLRG
jgi:hypothetical protein